MWFSEGYSHGEMRGGMFRSGVLAVLCLGVLACVLIAPQLAFAVEELGTSRQAAVDVQVVRSFVGYVDGDTQEYVVMPDAEAGQTPLIEGMQVKLQLLSTVVWSTGTAEYADDAGVPVTWESSNPSVAVVGEDGVVKPVGYGVVTITMRTSEDFGAIESSIDVSVGVWDGAYLEELVITDKGGTPLGDEPIVFPAYAQWQGSVQLHAVAHYSDGTTKSTASGDKITGIAWSTSWSDFGEIGVKTGLLDLRDAGSNTVRVTAPSGNGGDVAARAYVVTKGYGTGQFGSSSATITVHIVKDSADGWVERSSKTYSGGDLAAMWLERRVYTQMTGYGDFMTVTAKGVRVIWLLYDQGVKPSDVEDYYVSTVDGANKVRFSAARINEDGYYFPNADLGWANGAYAAPAMISIESYYERNRPYAYYGDLDSNARFHLVTGSKSITHIIDEQPLGGISDLYVLVQDESTTQ